MVATTQTAAGARPARRGFYLSMAFVCMAVAVVGFAPTYFVPMASGTLDMPPLLHVHGLFFFLWTAFLCAQAWLVASGHTISHRDWGLLGIALATAMVFSVFVTVVFRINQLTALGTGETMLMFSWVQVSGMLFFGAAVAAAIANLRRPEAHKRLMLLATISLMDAPIARWFLTFLAPPPPPGPLAAPPVVVTVPPALVADLLVVAAITYDWRSRGRPHPVWIVGGVLLLAMQLTRPMISATPQWEAVAVLLGRLGAP